MSGVNQSSSELRAKSQGLKADGMLIAKQKWMMIMANEPSDLKEEGLRLFKDGAYQEAIEQFDLAQQGFSQAGQKLDAAEMLNNMGVIHRIEGRLADAARMLEQAKEIFAQVGDRDREAQVLGNLAPLYKKQGDADKALEVYKQAADVFGEIGDKDKQGEILMALGLLQFEKGKRTEGLAAYETGLQMVSHPTGAQKRAQTMLKLRKAILGN